MANKQNTQAKGGEGQDALAALPTRRINCSLPDALGLLPGESELVQFHLGNMLAALFD